MTVLITWVRRDGISSADMRRWLDGEIARLRSSDEVAGLDHRLLQPAGQDHGVSFDSILEIELRSSDLERTGAVAEFLADLRLVASNIAVARAAPTESH